VLDGGQVGPPRGQERPVLLPLRPLLDPALEQRDLLRLEARADRTRRHALRLVLVKDAAQQLTLAGVARNDGVITPQIRESAGLGVEAGVGLAFALVGAVALEAGIRRDRADVAVELDRAGGPPAGARGGDRQGEREGRAEQERRALKHVSIL